MSLPVTLAVCGAGLPFSFLVMSTAIGAAPSIVEMALLWAYLMAGIAIGYDAARSGSL